jgi:glutamine synthetase
MHPMMSFDQLAQEVETGAIDTVVAAFPDMQGRLIGKRFHAEYFVESAHDETHACDYLLADDIEMEPVPGYKVASWEKGYGDLVMKPDLSTLRRIPWLEKTALCPLRRAQAPRSFAAGTRRAMCSSASSNACEA